ncbi:hypothetical protein [Actinoallomurus sp. NPDC050550]|uniref:hypothetical protein n=1 Tax=Actinoallomurus sp. NPDC050550 TaxID=3154937 RepID=UPI0033E820A5
MTKLIRRALAGAAAASAVLIAPLAAVPAADAATDGWAPLSAGHNVGIYDWTNSESNKRYGDLYYNEGSAVHATCWTRGETINNLGNVWYHIDAAIYFRDGLRHHEDVDGWVYGAYVDNNQTFHDGLAECTA